MNKLLSLILLSSITVLATIARAGPNPKRALKRVQYLFAGEMPTDDDLRRHGKTVDAYREQVRRLLEGESFYKALLRFHEITFGTGLKLDYIDELRKEDDSENQNKFARISCARTAETHSRLRCRWSSAEQEEGNAGQCPIADEQAASAFWYPGIIAWACPSVIRACGYDLSRCFIEYTNEEEARNTELGTTEIFDSRFSVVKSLAKQAAGIATRLATENYPYRLLLKSGLTAIDGAVAHLYRQSHHFKLDQLQIPNQVMDIVNGVSFTDNRFVLVNTDHSYESGGAISTFGWLRRYEKHRVRGNELYERLLCRKFTSELPRVFPQDPGNLRETPGCSGCHSTLDPLADFFKIWGEGGELYQGQGNAVETTFAGKSGYYVSDLAEIVSSDSAFATCTTMHVWEWLMGRKFYHDEDQLRAALTNYFIDRDYSLRELIYAVATHPAFIEESRSDGTVSDPLEDPPLGEVPSSAERECIDTIDYTTDIAPDIDLCTTCHNSSSGSRADLSAEADWLEWGQQAVDLMSSGQMPPGQFGPDIIDFKEKVRCWLEQ